MFKSQLEIVSFEVFLNKKEFEQQLYEIAIFYYLQNMNTRTNYLANYE